VLIPRERPATEGEWKGSLSLDDATARMIKHLGRPVRYPNHDWPRNMPYVSDEVIDAAIKAAQEPAISPDAPAMVAYRTIWALWVETGGLHGIHKFATEVNDVELLKIGHLRVSRLNFSFVEKGLGYIELKLKRLGAEV